MEPVVTVEKVVPETQPPVEVAVVENKAEPVTPTSVEVDNSKEAKKEESTVEYEYSAFSATGSTFISSILNMTNTIIGAVRCLSPVPFSMAVLSERACCWFAH